MSELSRRETLVHGGQVAAAAAMTTLPTGAQTEPLTRDIKLLVLSQRHKETFRQAERLQEIEDVLYPHRADQKAEYTRARDHREQEWGEVSEIESQIVATPANTFAGIAIKLRVAAIEIPKDAHDPNDLAILGALADAERLAGRASAV